MTMKDGRKDHETSQFLPSVFAPVFYCTKRGSTKAGYLVLFLLFFRLRGQGNKRKRNGEIEIRIVPPNKPLN